MPDLWFYGILNFLKNVRGSSNFRKSLAIVLRLHTNILYRSRNFGIEFGQNRLKLSNFFRLWIFWEFSQNRAEILCVNITHYWVMFNTKSCKNRSKPLNFRWIRIFYFFFIWYQILKIRCNHEASSVRKPKSSSILPQRKNFVKSVRKQYRNPDSDDFLFCRYRKQDYFSNWCLPSGFFFVHIHWYFECHKVNKVDRRMLRYLYRPDNKTL